METFEPPSAAMPAANHEDPRLQKAKRLAQSGKLRRSAEIFQAVLKSSPDDPDALHYYGIVLHQLRRPNRALASIKKSLSIAPDNPHALNSLGNVLKERDEYAEAEEVYTSALKLDPVNAQCLNNLGNVQRLQGRTTEAIASLKEAVRLAPDLTEAHFNLANLCYDEGLRDEALSAFQESFKRGGDWRDPVPYAKLLIAHDRRDDAEEMLVEFLKHKPSHNGARHQLSAIRGETPATTDEKHVAREFDSFAKSFDGVLKGLGYRAPELVVKTVAERLGPPAGDQEVLDLGCGTGLCGPLIAPYKANLVGIDLSNGMLERAEKLKCYDSLRAAELQQFLQRHTPDSVDVILCVDTLVYIGALERTLAGVAKTLKPGGIFVASLEKRIEGEGDYALGIFGRFQHSRQYLERLAEENGLTVASLREEVLRKEAGEPVIGYVVEYTR